MNRSFLNNVEFDPKIILKLPDKPSKPRRKILSRFLPLLSFLFVLFILLLAGKYAVESFVGACWGSDHHVTWQEMKDVWDKQKRK